ncbi:MAG TPA: hypothetical protein VIT65_23255 [Microlunatus sp.]
MSTHPHITHDDIEHRFGYHRATFPVGYDPRTTTTRLTRFSGDLDEDGNVATAPRHAFVRQTFIAAADALIEIVPEGREQALMLTALQEAAMWANAGVAMQSPLIRE